MTTSMHACADTYALTHASKLHTHRYKTQTLTTNSALTFLHIT